MLIDGLNLLGGSEATNFTIASGVAFPTDTNSTGELFYLTGAEAGLYTYTGSDWVKSEADFSQAITGTVVRSTAGFASAEYDGGNSGAAVTVNWANGQNQKITLTSNTIVTLSNPTNGATYKLKLIQDGNGSRIPTFSPTPKWVGGITPAVSTSSGETDIISLYYDGTSYFAQASLAFA